MQCNIDARGKLLRLIYGLLFLIAGVLLTLFWARPNHSTLAWIISILLILAGAFAIFEAHKGWCILRATGFKTPL